MKSNLKRSLAFLLAISIVLSLCLFNVFADEWVLSDSLKEKFDTLYNSTEAVDCAEDGSTTKMVWFENELYILGEGDAAKPASYFNPSTGDKRVLCINIGPDVVNVPSLYSGWFNNSLWGSQIGFGGTTRRVFHIYGENTVLKDISLQGLNCSSYQKDYIRFIVNPKNTALIERLTSAGFVVIEAKESGVDGDFTWDIDYLNHGLTISGNGEMPTHYNRDTLSISNLDELAPWNARLYDTYIGNFKNTMAQDLRGLYMITNLTLSNTITSIAPYSFYGMALENLQLPTGLKKIGAYAFSNYEGYRYETGKTKNYGKSPSISLLGIPTSVEEIGNGAFAYWKLETLNLPNTNLKVGSEAFYSPETYLTINCKATTQEINIGAFNKSKMFYQEPHKGIAYISQQNETLREAAMQANYEVQFFDEVFTYNGNTITGLTEYGKTLKDLRIPKVSSDNTSITTIGANAFEDCPNAKTLYIDSNITSISTSAFLNTVIETITINNKKGSITYEPWGASDNTEIIWLIPCTITVDMNSFDITGGETWSAWLNSKYGNSDKIRLDGNGNVQYYDSDTWKYIRKYSGASKQTGDDILNDGNSYSSFVLHSMTIDGKTYNFEPNQEWYNWVYSAENTDSFSYEGSETSIFSSTGDIVAKEDGTEVSKTDKIENDGTYITIDADANKPHISIDGKSYIIDEYMTFASWVLSEYNTDGFTFSNSEVISSQGDRVVDSDGNLVSTGRTLYNGDTFFFKHYAITIDSTSYKIENGQSWLEWVNSANNTESFYSDGNFVRTKDNGFVKTEWNSQVRITDSVYDGQTFSTIPATISFSIDNVSYQAEAFSTFMTWVTSPSNTQGFKKGVTNEILDTTEKKVVIDSKGQKVIIWNQIENAGEYFTKVPDTISFTIDGKSYKAKEFDSIQVWVKSANNIDSFILDDSNNLRNSDKSKVVKDASSSMVYGNYELKDGDAFTLYQPQTLTFSIDSVPYTFLEYQTLRDWIKGPYNTDNYALLGNYAISQEGAYIGEYSNPVYVATPLQANKNYDLIIPSDITITIDGTSYQAKQYQPLEAWAKSDFNTLGLHVSGSFIKSTNGKKVLFRENSTYPESYSTQLYGNENFVLKTSNVYQIYIDEVAYQYDEYMSVKEWVRSEYNTDAYKLMADDTNAGEDIGSGSGDTLFLANSKGNLIEHSTEFFDISERYTLQERNNNEKWRSKASSPIKPTETGIWSYVDDIEVSFPDVQPRIINGEVVSPIRFIFTDLGAEVYWNQEEQKVTIRKEENNKKIEIVMKPGSSSMWVNGAEYNNTEIGLDATVLIEDGRCLLPGRAIIKAWETWQFKATHNAPTSYKDYYYKTSTPVDGADSKLQDIPTIEDWQEENPGTQITEDNEKEVFKPSTSGSNTQIVVDAEVTMFDVIVPIKVNASMKRDGTVEVKGEYKVENKCALGPVIITDIKVVAADGWKVAAYDADFANMKASSKVIGIAINEARTGADGQIVMNDSLSSVIKHKSSKNLTFEIKLPAQKKALTEVAAGVVFTVAFDTV